MPRLGADDNSGRQKNHHYNFKYPIETETDERVREENFSCNSFNVTKFL